MKAETLFCITLTAGVLWCFAFPMHLPYLVGFFFGFMACYAAMKPGFFNKPEPDADPREARE